MDNQQTIFPITVAEFIRMQMEENPHTIKAVELRLYAECVEAANTAFSLAKAGKIGEAMEMEYSWPKTLSADHASVRLYKDWICYAVNDGADIFHFGRIIE